MGGGAGQNKLEVVKFLEKLIGEGVEKLLSLYSLGHVIHICNTVKLILAYSIPHYNDMSEFKSQMSNGLGKRGCTESANFELATRIFLISFIYQSNILKDFLG